MVHALLEELRVDRVQEVHEISARGTLVLRVFVWQVREELRVILEPREDALDGQLVVVWHLDELHLRLLKQMLLAGQHLLKEVLIYNVLIGQVIL